MPQLGMGMHYFLAASFSAKKVGFNTALSAGNNISFVLYRYFHIERKYSYISSLFSDRDNKSIK
jgi:hypothetical protein